MIGLPGTPGDFHLFQQEHLPLHTHLMESMPIPGLTHVGHCTTGPVELSDGKWTRQWQLGSAQTDGVGGEKGEK